jgi:hypothetical protein
MIPDADRIVEQLRRLVDEGTPVDIPGFVRAQDARAAERAFDLILTNPSAFSAHPHAVAGLRVLAELRKLTAGGATSLLRHTETLAREAGHDEWYKSLEALALTRETATVLLPFAEQLLTHRNVRDWLWLAFVALEGAMRNDLRPEPLLQQSLRREIERERDPQRRVEMRSLLSQSGI